MDPLGAALRLFGGCFVRAQTCLHAPLTALEACRSPVPAPTEPRLSRYSATDGVYTLTTPYERDASCPICSSGVPFAIAPTATLQQVGRQRGVPGVARALGWWRSQCADREADASHCRDCHAVPSMCDF